MEAEDLASQWERLHLSKEESACFHVKQENINGDEKRDKYCMVGKALTEKGVNNEGFRITMSQIWRLEGWVTFKELGEQCFLIEFQKIRDKEKVLSGRPWFFDRHLLTMMEVDDKESIDALQFRFEPFWIQLHNLPLSVMTKGFGEQFAEAIGLVIRVDAEEDGRAWGRCLRVRVAVDLNKPLLRGKWLKLDDKQHWVAFKYERLQNFCFHCGVLNHKGKGCLRSHNAQQGDTQPSTQFGPWL
ncbi:uncharacterized protein LOC121247347 [Juglans microcarpa x Juglans regia]|uniref:uncharacterized protein LOC121247347 n=1 Tax=Juglans microcarpa x Juglans regia TaxID=2249226 RepID=UPI001B7D989E|nr:uncharacterized protein LOC121247347 [Juglans microcarpa x Juglans regia]